jgi:glycosidase
VSASGGALILDAQASAQAPVGGSAITSYEWRARDARGQDGNAQHYFDWSNLKNLNYGNPEVQRLVIEAFAHWIREFDIDGFRVDAAWGPPAAGAGFLAAMAPRVEAHQTRPVAARRSFGPRCLLRPERL